MCCFSELILFCDNTAAKVFIKIIIFVYTILHYFGCNLTQSRSSSGHFIVLRKNKVPRLNLSLAIYCDVKIQNKNV